MRVISGKAKGTVLYSPRDSAIRPTTDKVKGTVFNRLMNVYPEDQVLDLFAGAGGVGIEFLSRGVENVVFVEQNRHHCQLIEDNLDKTHLSGQIICMDVEGSLRKFAMEGRKFDIIFMDPPYGEGFAEKTLNLIDNLKIVKENGLVIVEHEAELSLEHLDLELAYVDKRTYGSIGVTYFKKES
jgi:16S rRNA (guanine(966)-N(2))-methyltransferase RsmD